jgi:hypothetical protein
MNIIESKVYSFSFNVEGVGYNFQITATNQQEAIEKLHRAMNTIQKELLIELSRPQNSELRTAC